MTDSFKYRKGGYCKCCKVKVTSIWSHMKTFKHISNYSKYNNYNFVFE